ncbi:DUF952 domain-containing protein [Salipaludibacillus agaradhaerens]|uniref:DUF952 domain-containing protein n=1 Tax=Salipaludibacillus agaradhaerens TaxID=76935 RepID=A0A9Q4B0W1_SALAG|nr:DUF952 domain-containing protein [Salipaludibacillus agaradhaerens]MCR6096307.1 DUF952 domain-containing protein [Salipaludibacillus agaradhaerens]MCR6114134.1 DUF952 domain-containing protein [Salipaludibacillus agaradhaerens]
MIYYLITKEEWEYAKQDGEYWPSDFDDRGYIPCADPGQTEQLVRELNLQGESLILLSIDTQKLESVVIYEDVAESGRMSPHVYGYINIDAVKSVDEYDTFPITS